MNLHSHKKVWESLAAADPMWAILTTEEKRGKWDVEEFFREGEKEVRQLMNDLEALKIPLEYNAVLDFGCGMGRVTQALCHYFKQATGVDISSRMISLAEQFNRHPERCRYVVNNAPHLQQCTSDSFDLVYSNIVLQHIAPSLSKQYIREFVRVVKPGGLIVFQLPSWLHWRRRIQWRRRVFVILQSLGVKGTALVKRGFNPMRMAFIPRRDVETLLTSCKMTILDVKSWSDENAASCRYIAMKGNA